MTILITNLEDCLEDMTDDEMQQLSGGISISFEASLLEAYEHIYLPGLKKTRRIVGREREGVV